MIIIKKVSCLGIKNAQLFDIEITYIEDGKLCVRKTTAAEVLRLLKYAETDSLPEDGEIASCPTCGHAY